MRSRAPWVPTNDLDSGFVLPSCTGRRGQPSPAQRAQEPASLASRSPPSVKDTAGTKVTLGRELPSCLFDAMSATRVPRAGVLDAACYLFLCRGPGGDQEPPPVVTPQPPTLLPQAESEA